MKRLILFSMFFVLVFAVKQTYAQFENPNMGVGIAVGGAQGDNTGNEDWVLQYRGYFQYKLVRHYLIGELHAGYLKLHGPGRYTAETVIAENRFLFTPFSLESLNPFLYTGFGVSKAVDENGTDFLPMIPMGLGIQTRLSSQLLLEISAGYNVSLSDKMDGITRSDNNLNTLTNKKQDAFTGFLVGLTFAVGSNENADRDKDGLSAKMEKELGTDPKIADTDGDGLKDGAEVNQYATDPLKSDSDDDGLSDAAEVNQYKTNPLKADSDGDGLSDADEVNKHETDPLKADTDGDGLNDGAEVNQYKTNPLKTDTDGDGLSDGVEVNQYKTDPQKVDTDGDGLKDGAEVNQYKTDPLKADTDSDGLSDAEEVNTYKTNPLMIDSDSGGMADGAEVKSKTNPMDSSDDITSTIVLEKGKRLILQGVNFKSNQATLTDDSKSILEEAYKALLLNPDVRVEISGYTDNVGSDEYNQKLSLRRAQAVKNWLVQRGIASNRMKTVGKGEMEPVASNDTAQGRAQNRRIEFYVE